LLATALPAGFAELFLKALRAVACGAALVRAGTEDFDFAAIFFGLATALAMTDKTIRERGRGARLTPLWAVPRKVRARTSSAQM
jgi:hypothetical protein